ncbi:carbohydrate ABC transporter permease [Clostridium algidicarnis]|uniref:Carbohydrate ABC transporter membrane protein 2 (CUT1 family) n=1 Tax=Clostridium algidicarnis DSM 15099 TaxID=1121295 RepID=A0A2S6FXR6_9CLOT|nr:carbohydrate ABC transporter permease [Clostridium algidicarnis]MBU3196663.1 carbohydrate ABC transporter permease [Clostridium algidicarnis]MBU3204416.1 carbohydrate ABC transporter permease [Clostridium algidicarnis]MBU3212501.1 carbohydrate ABC transporter permease [Clostridium algidicarnis]MBU3222932.1 carbohydrate ABC transporter permease [Clostridium algidicarnis]PPK48319.1 carbohydrate ABC transporter membrane protein 2 (CUT1 family) [Clostridium algidicarnis DSM 15099]
MKREKYNPNKRINNKIGLYAFLGIMSLVFICPMLFTIISSLKQNNEIFSNPFSLPKVFRYENYIVAWKEANMSKYFLNSIMISLATVIILAIVASMAAYVLARFDFKVNKYISIFFLLGMMIPMHTILVPVSYLIGRLGLKNNLVALVLLYVAFSLPFSIFVLTNFMKGINLSLEEAAIIDGAGYFQIYTRIILPLSVPAISTISIFNFLGAWNNILFPLLFINDDRLKPISLGLLNFSGERGSEYGPLMAAIVITVVVPLIIYLLFQEKVEGGLAAGAVKE